MSEAKKLLCEYIELAQKTLAEFERSENSAMKLLGTLKESMSQKRELESGRELFEACVYNALATINTAPNQNKKNVQLIEALAEAREEMILISEML